MDIKDYLLTSKAVNQAEVARRMWPKNKTAKSYLNQKLKGINNRSFTKKDAELAYSVLQKIGIEYKELTIADSY